MRVAPIAAFLLLAACGSGAEKAGVSEEVMEPGVDPDIAAMPAPAAFNRCRACHSVEPGETGLGPSLAGVFGAPAGHVAGFAYSDAMAGADIVWDEETLHVFLADPRGVVHGTKMVFAGIRDEAQRQEVIDYLKAI